jgi:hypothetical protein
MVLEIPIDHVPFVTLWHKVIGFVCFNPRIFNFLISQNRDGIAVITSIRKSSLNFSSTLIMKNDGILILYISKKFIFTI